MFIRFRAEVFKVGNKTMVELYDHKTGRTLVMTLKQYHRISDILSNNGGIIFGHKEES